MPSRRTVLAVLVVVALAGCVGGLPGPGSLASPAGSPDGTSTATPTECTGPNQTPVDPIREDVTPSAYPDGPETWDESSVRAYVVGFQEAWSRNQHLRPETKRVTVSVWDVSVTSTDDGYRVRLTSQTNTWYGGPAEGNRTATTVHGDGPHLSVGYYLSDDRLVRTEGGRETPTVGPMAGPSAASSDTRTPGEI
ncbi:hypothetical protein BRC89_05770 [Halobacteriales archaeon QS_4_70_19]|nr:MAG: hypothetical protein BRC89_05770 [Halobacteriales archaeon QS_4_70_19]